MIGTMITIIALVALILVAMHFLNGGIALINNRKWKITRNSSPIDVSKESSKMFGAFFVVISLAFFICTIPIFFYLLPLIK